MIAARVNGELRDLAWQLADGDAVEPVGARQRRRAGDPAALHRARAGPGGAGAVPRGQARHRPADRERLLLRLRRGRSRSAPTTSRPSSSGCARSSSRASGSPAGSVTDEQARAELAGEPYKLELIGLKGGGRGRRRGAGRGRRQRADHLRQPRPGTGELQLEGPVPRPARADHPAHPGVQADAHRRRVLAGQREEPAAAADLRHRVGVARGAGRVPDAAGRGRAARPPPARRRAGPVLVPARDRQRAAGVPPQGRHHPPGDGGLLAAAGTSEAGLRVRRTPRTSPRSTLFETSGPPRLVRRRHVSRPWRWRARSTTRSR